MAAAVSTSTLRGLGSWKIRPIAQAPSSTASAASSRRVIPQILTRTGLRLGERRAAARIRRRTRLIVERGRARTELDPLRLELVVAVDLDLDRLARAVVVDRRCDVVGLRDLLPVDLHDHIAAKDHALVGVDLPGAQT